MDKPLNEGNVLKVRPRRHMYIVCIVNIVIQQQQQKQQQKQH